jgi:NAD(P)H dehydrogenase (quinone)
MRTTRIAIVYHSGFGHTARQAQAVKAAGVQLVPGAEALLMTTDDAQSRWEDLAAAEAIIFGSPTYMASASAQFKAFAESSSPAVFAKGLACKNKLAAGFTNSGAQSGDKLATLTQIALFAAQHGMHWVSLGSDRRTAKGGGGQSARRLPRRRSAVELRREPRDRAAGIGPGHGSLSRQAGRGPGCANTRCRFRTSRADCPCGR